MQQTKPHKQRKKPPQHRATAQTNHQGEEQGKSRREKEREGEGIEGNDLIFQFKSYDQEFFVLLNKNKNLKYELVRKNMK